MLFGLDSPVISLLASYTITDVNVSSSYTLSIRTSTSLITHSFQQHQPPLLLQQPPLLLQQQQPSLGCRPLLGLSLRWQLQQRPPHLGRRPILLGRPLPWQLQPPLLLQQHQPPLLLQQQQPPLLLQQQPPLGRRPLLGRSLRWQLRQQPPHLVPFPFPCLGSTVLFPVTCTVPAAPN